jgi:hypothetical protein
MKRIIFLAIPFLTLVTVVLSFATLEAQRKPDWRIELDGYITDNFPSETITVKEVVVAARPGNFNDAMGQPIRGRGWRWGIDELPYPPQALRCALLERKDNSTGLTQRQVVFVGYHTDTLWRVGWLVHTGPKAPFTPEFMTNLVRLGCALNLN